MASIKTNGPAIRQAILQLPDALNMRRRSPLSARSLGGDLQLRIAFAIRLRTLRNQTDPQGRRLAKLNPRYRRWKLQHGLNPKVDIATGKMLAMSEILGTSHISKNELSMTYGKTESEQLKAEWTTEGNVRRHRPARPFYDLGEDGERAIESLLDAALEATLAGL